MAFEFLRYVTHGEILAMVVLQDGSSVSWLIFLGQVVYLFEILLGVAMAVLGAIGVLYCFGRNDLCPSIAHIDERCDSLSNDRQAHVEEPSERNTEVTIRLEDGPLWLLRRHRCIVTVNTPLGGVQNAGREVWYAREEKSRG